MCEVAGLHDGGSQHGDIWNCATSRAGHDRGDTQRHSRMKLWTRTDKLRTWVGNDFAMQTLTASMRSYAQNVRR